MKKYKPGLYIAALAFLICVFAPYDANAQDDGPVPWPCNSLNSYGLNSPWPCVVPTQDDGHVPRPYHTLAQNGGLMARPYDARALDDGFVPRLNNIFASITPSMGGEILYQPALFEGRRQEFALIRGRLMDASVAHIRISAAFCCL